MPRWPPQLRAQWGLQPLPQRSKPEVLARLLSLQRLLRRRPATQGHKAPQATTERLAQRVRQVAPGPLATPVRRDLLAPLVQQERLRQ